MILVTSGTRCYTITMKIFYMDLSHPRYTYHLRLDREGIKMRNKICDCAWRHNRRFTFATGQVPTHMAEVTPHEPDDEL